MLEYCASVAVKNTAHCKINSVPGNPRTPLLKMSSVPSKEHCSFSDQQCSLTETAVQYSSTIEFSRNTQSWQY